MSSRSIPPGPTDADHKDRGDMRGVEDHAMFRADDPIALFESWMEEAVAAEPNNANAMTLATVDTTGLPDARMVLLKGLDDRGFVFYTNENSAKGEQLKAKGKAALCFHWKSLRRQVRVRGPVSAVGKKTSDEYFKNRVRGSQIAAWASNQSSPIFDREELTEQVEAAETRFKGSTVIRPPHWYGWRVTPISIEFWEDGAYRLHDRRRFYRPRVAARWLSERLSP